MINKCLAFVLILINIYLSGLIKLDFLKIQIMELNFKNEFLKIKQ